MARLKRFSGMSMSVLGDGRPLIAGRRGGAPMPKVFLTHEPEMLRNYYGARAVAALREVAEVVINPTGQVLDSEALTREVQGCEIVVSDRQTPGFSAFFERAPDLVAF